MRALFKRRRAGAGESKPVVRGVERTRLASPRPLADGATIGRYDVVRHVGSGGTSDVYEAIHTGLKKRVALKVLRSELAGRDDVKARFLREGEIAARIQHPNVVDVIDVGASGDVPFIVMEYLEGETLADLLARQKRLDVQHIVHIMLPVLAAVAAGHDIHVVHGDLKPNNLFLATDGRRRTMPKVLDFGMSRVLTDAELDSGRAPRVIGTPYYMSTEQARGEPAIDVRSDQFALGVILYEASTGRLPWRNRNILGLIHEVRGGDFAPPSTHRPNIDPMFEAVILRAMRRIPADRFEHARAMGAALLRFASLRAREYWALELGNAAARGTRANDPAAQPFVLGPDGPLSDPAPSHRALERQSARSAADASAPRTRSRASVWVVGAAALLGGGAYVMLEHPHAAAPPPAPEAAAPAASGAESSYDVAVRARPESTRIEFDGKHVADGAYSARLPLDGSTHVIRLSARGFEPMALTFRDAPPPTDVELVPAPEPTAEPGAQTSTPPLAVVAPRVAAPKRRPPPETSPSASAEPSSTPPAVAVPSPAPPADTWPRADDTWPTPPRRDKGDTSSP